MGYFPTLNSGGGLGTMASPWGQGIVQQNGPGKGHCLGQDTQVCCHTVTQWTHPGVAISCHLNCSPHLYPVPMGGSGCLWPKLP